MPVSDQGRLAGLVEALAQVPDQRDPRGMVHTLVGVLAVAMAAVLAGARSVAAIGEWAADAPQRILAGLGVFRDPFTGAYRAPVTSTIRRILVGIDADWLDNALSRWLTASHPSASPAGGSRWRAYAVDGKTLCGSGRAGAQRHLLAVLDQHTATVRAQVEVDGKR